ncbi:MAG: DUF6049 family protein [Nocardioidaceae bacterium]
MRRLVAATTALLCCSAVPAVGVTDSAPAHDPSAAVSAADLGADRPQRSDRPARSGVRGVADDELTVTIKKLNTTYLEKRKPIRIRAKVRNTTDQKWSDLQAYLVLNNAPLTDRDSLQEFADSPSDAYSGERVSVTRDLTKVGGLDIGESKAFTVKVPFKRLQLEPTNGVYEVGVHVLGTDELKNRDVETDGRARTLLPYLDERTASEDPIEISMVWPFTTKVRRSADGTYPDAATLIEAIAPDGRLGRMLSAAKRAPPRSITVLLDPAMLEELSAIARDSYGPPESGSESLQSDDSGSGSAQDLANTYLSDLRSVAAAQDVWLSPYAHPDLDALAAHEPSRQAAAVYQASEDAARDVLGRFGVNSDRIAYLPPEGIAELDSLQWAQSNTDTSDSSTAAPAAILAPAMLNDWDDSGSPLVSLDADGHTIPTVVDDGTVMSGGPLPGRTDSALQVRQRLASEAAVRAIERTVDGSTSEQVAVVVDPAWNPGPTARRIDLFDVLDPTWVTPVSPDQQLDGAEDWRGPVGVPDAEEAQADTPVADGRVEAAAKIVRNADDLASMLDAGDALRAYYGGTASMVVSQNWRGDPIGADAYSSDAVDEAGSQLDGVTIEGPGFVSFSGNSGPLPITIHNGLDVPVTVGVTIEAQGAQLSVPNMEAETIQPGQSPSFTINADIGEVSNTAFKATLTTPAGDTFGKPAKFNVRSSVVGMAIWIGMGVAGVLVVLALVRQIRRRRAAASIAGEAEQ